MLPSEQLLHLMSKMDTNKLNTRESVLDEFWAACEGVRHGDDEMLRLFADVVKDSINSTASASCDWPRRELKFASNLLYSFTEILRSLLHEYKPLQYEDAKEGLTEMLKGLENMDLDAIDATAQYLPQCIDVSLSRHSDYDVLFIEHCALYLTMTGCTLAYGVMDAPGVQYAWN